MTDPLRILIVEARFYDDIADELVAGAVGRLKEAGAAIDSVAVPGAFEIPGAISIAAEGSRHIAGSHFDGYVALGCVIRGETTHYDYVCGESARGLQQLSVEQRLAIGYGILTVENRDQAWARAARDRGNKGGAAVSACLDMIGIKQKFGTS